MYIMAKVFLRSLEEGDVNENYLSWFKDKEVTKFLRVDGDSLTLETVRDYIKHGSDTKSYFMYAICLKENNKHIGNLKIGPIDYKHAYSDLVTVIGDRTQWGKGLATEAVQLGIKLAFEKYNIRKLSAGIISGNIGSIKAYTNAGFRIEGTLKDQYVVNNEYQDRVMVGCFNPNYVRK